eukprot:XP_014777265.1 PREDICTED: uncharacterized protein LOC106874155 [Octopus bimaculoides]
MDLTLDCWRLHSTYCLPSFGVVNNGKLKTRLLVALLLTGIAVILQDCLVSSSCIFTANTYCPTINYYQADGQCNNTYCPTINYYQADGQCNNVASKYAGSASSPLSRYMTYLATGGTGALPYKNLFGQVLPPPRKVSMDLFPCQDATVSDATHLFTIFGNLLMFDLFLTEKGSTGSICDCLIMLRTKEDIELSEFQRGHIVGLSEGVLSIKSQKT